MLVAQSHRLCNPTGCSPPGSSVCGIFQARIPELGCHFFLHGIFLTKGLNPCLFCFLRWQKASLPLVQPLPLGLREAHAMLQVCFMDHSLVVAKGLVLLSEAMSRESITPDGRVPVKSSDKTWSTGEGKGRPLQYSCCENPINSMKRQENMTPEGWNPPQVGRCLVCFSQKSRAQLLTAPERMRWLGQIGNDAQLWMCFILRRWEKTGSHLTAIQESQAQILPSLSPEGEGAAGTISSWLLSSPGWWEGQEHLEGRIWRWLPTARAVQAWSLTGMHCASMSAWGPPAASSTVS